MELPVNILMWFFAALPIITLLVLMVGFQFSASKAAPIALIISIITGVVLYKASASVIIYEALKGLWSSVSVMLVVFPAILIYEVTNAANAFDVFKKGIQKFTGNELLQIMIFGWVFAGFMQGITGFGVPVAVASPLLLGLGVTPLYAVIIPLVGHAWANTFGTLAVAWNALTDATGLVAGSAAFNETALWAALFLAIFNVTTGIMICYMYGKKEGIKMGLPACLTISLVHAGGQLLFSQINTTIAAFLPTTICLLVAILLGRTKRYSKPWRIENSPCFDRTKEVKSNDDESFSLLQAFTPYICLMVITFVCLVIKPVNTFLGQFKIGFAFPETITGYGIVNAASDKFSPIAPLTHAGVFLIISSFIGYMYFKKKGRVKTGDGKKVVMNALNKTIPSAISVILLLMMSKVMAGTGQTDVLAQGTANVLQKLYVIFVPFVGMLGAFMTSSNMASNILFAKFQQITATTLGLNICAILGGQTAGGAIGNIICPGNVVLGCTTAGIIGEEGKVLRKTLPIATGVAIAIGVILMIVMIVA